MAIATILRDGADDIERDGTPAQIGPTPHDLRFAADHMEHLAKLLLTALALHGGEAHTHSEKEWRDEARRALGLQK